MIAYNTQICPHCRKRFNCSTYLNSWQCVPHLIDTDKCGFKLRRIKNGK